MRIGLQNNQTQFEPGETIAGAVDWSGEKVPTGAEVRLGWFTRGAGLEDSEVYETSVISGPEATDLRQFSFQAPLAPYSFSGEFVSLVWTVELLLQPGRRVERCEIVIAPGGRAVALGGTVDDIIRSPG